MVGRDRWDLTEIQLQKHAHSTDLPGPQIELVQLAWRRADRQHSLSIPVNIVGRTFSSVAAIEHEKKKEKFSDWIKHHITAKLPTAVINTMPPKLVASCGTCGTTPTR